MQHEQNNEQALAPVFSMPADALFIPNENAIAALQNAQALEMPEAQNWDIENTKKIRGFYLYTKTEWFPSLRQGAPAGEKEEVETVFFKGLIDGKPKDLYCAARQFVRKIKHLRDMMPEGKKFGFEAEFLGMEGKIPLRYKNFNVRLLNM